MSVWLLGSEWQYRGNKALLFCGGSLAHLGVLVYFPFFFFCWLLKPASCRLLPLWFSWIPSVRKSFLRAFRGFYMEKLIVVSVHFPVSWLSLFTMCLVSFPSACFQFGCWLTLSQLLGSLLFGSCLPHCLLLPLLFHFLVFLIFF